jgi:hypothetical protein
MDGWMNGWMDGYKNDTLVEIMYKCVFDVTRQMPLCFNSPKFVSSMT